VHQLGFADLMVALQLLGDSPDEIVVLGVQPESVDWSAELTPPVEKALAPLVDCVIAQLQSWATLESRKENTG
jgi:hydrogenase maturation protease